MPLATAEPALSLRSLSNSSTVAVAVGAAVAGRPDALILVRRHGDAGVLHEAPGGFAHGRVTERATCHTLTCTKTCTRAFPSSGPGSGPVTSPAADERIFEENCVFGQNLRAFGNPCGAPAALGASPISPWHCTGHRHIHMGLNVLVWVSTRAQRAPQVAPALEAPSSVGASPAEAGPAVRLHPWAPPRSLPAIVWGHAYADGSKCSSGAANMCSMCATGCSRAGGSLFSGP